jgi:signal peptidase I
MALPAHLPDWAFRIPSGSMENTLLIGDFLFVNKLLYGAEVPLIHALLPALREPRRGEILVFDSVEEEGLKVVKRLIGVPGDTLAMKAGTLAQRCPGRAVGVLETQRLRRFVPRSRCVTAGVSSVQTRPPTIPICEWGPIVVPDGHFFMMGDNRDDSYDGATGLSAARECPGPAADRVLQFDPSSWRPLPFFTAIRWGRIFALPR